MKSFQYAAPATVKEATESLEDTWGKTEILAGGTDLITSLKQRITTPDSVISLKNISALKGIKSEGDVLRIGSMTTMAELADHEAVKKHFPSLITAIEGVGAAQIISVGTVGGDLCQRPRCWFFRNGFGLFGQDGETSLVREGDNRYHAIFATDGPALFVSPSSLGPALVALGATIHIEGPDAKRRTVPASEFFQRPKTAKDRETVLRPNEILTAIEVPIRGLKNATYEVRHREGLDWPYVNATVAFRVQNNSAADSRVVLGHVAPTPWMAKEASQVLNGAQINESVAAKCGEAAVTDAKPLSRNDYKVQLVKTAVKRAVLAATKA
jgi:xanthine dehydrogenase YagS FAD-binding subunit